MSITKLRPAFTLTQDRLADLKSVVPEAFADGAINWEALKEALGDYLEDDSANAEHFGLFWPGKREARRLAAMPSKGALHPARGAGIDEDTTRNLFIEGDNLEVLKLLLKSYAGRVKMIYIDPPYNTGNDFVYKDDYTETIMQYARRTGQTDDQGTPVTTNTKAVGRFHSNWLNMMLPRLRLARALLEEDGIIFVSIDDNEEHHLRMLLNEVFGEESFAGTFVWQSKKGGGSDNSGAVQDHEYILCFVNLADAGGIRRTTVEAEVLDKSDEKGPYRRGRELNKWGSNSRREDRPTMYFPIRGPRDEDVFPIRNDGSEGRWRWGRAKMEAIVARGDVEFVPRGDGTYIIYEKIRTTDPRSKPYRTWIEDVGTTADGSKTVRDIFGGHKVFDFAKPVDLLKHLIRMGTEEHGDIVLDFFAGSCTTAQATLELNREDGGDRQFICIQLPESTAVASEARKAGYSTIADIGKERIRRVIRQLRGDGTQPTLLEGRDSPEDLGFKVYKLGRSNFREWQDYEGEDVEAVGTLFDQAVSPLMDDWRPDDVLTEVMLQEGFPLDSTVTRQMDLTMNAVLVVTSDTCAHRLFVCLDNQIADATISQLRMDADDIFVCLDSALTDEAKMRLGDAHHVHVI